MCLLLCQILAKKVCCWSRPNDCRDDYCILYSSSVTSHLTTTTTATTQKHTTMPDYTSTNLLGLVNDNEAKDHGDGHADWAQRSRGRRRAQTASATMARSGGGGQSASDRHPFPSMDEHTPLLWSHQEQQQQQQQQQQDHHLHPDESTPRRPGGSSTWRSMLRANSSVSNTPTLRRIETPLGEALVITRPRPRRHPIARYFATLTSAPHWWSLFHLVILNLPLMILVWPIVVAGTLIGTVLLILFPLGALTWLILLLLCRSLCRLEISLQTSFHSPLRRDVPEPVYFPIWSRIKSVPASSYSGPVYGTAMERPVVRLERGGQPHGQVAQVVMERNVLKNAWSLFTGRLSHQFN